MPSPIPQWELDNIRYFLEQYLRKKAQDLALEVTANINVHEDYTHMFLIKNIHAYVIKKKYTIHLDGQDDVTINLNQHPGKSIYWDLFIKPEDLLKLRSHIHKKILAILNLYFTGKSVLDWLIESSQLPPNPRIHKQLEQTHQFCLYQDRNLIANPIRWGDFKITMTRILKELADYTPEQTQEGGFSMHPVVTLKPEIGSKLVRRKKIENIGISFVFHEPSLSKLTTYDNLHFRKIFSVEYWIEEALAHSIYKPQRYTVTQPLRKNKKNKFTMIIEIINDHELPPIIEIRLKEFMVLIKSRSLGTLNNVKVYKLTLNKDEVCFLNTYFYKRAAGILNTHLRPAISSTAQWLLYQENDQQLVSKLCLLLNTTMEETKLLILTDILTFWYKLTGKNYDNSDKLPAKSGANDSVEIIKNEFSQIIGIFYEFQSLVFLINNYSFDLYLEPTLASQDQHEQIHAPHAQAFNGNKLALALNRETKSSDHALPAKKLRLQDETQSPFATSIVQECPEENVVIKQPDIAKIGGKIITAEQLQFFKSTPFIEKAPTPASLSPEDNKEVEAHREPSSIMGAQPLSL